MAGQTQLRLSQMTGSVVDFKPSAIAVGSTAATFGANDLSGSFEYFAQALSNIHGSTEFGSQTPGTFSFADGTNVDIILDLNDAGQKIHLDSEGAVDIDAVTGITVNSVGAAMSLVVTADAAAEDLTISQDGAVDSSILLVSAGTGADAISAKASAGSIVIEAQANNKSVTIKGDHESGTAVHIDANQNALSVLLMDAGALDINVTAAANIDSVGFDLNAGSGTIELTTTGAGDLNFNALDLSMTDSSLIAITSSEAAEDLTIQQIGANDSGIAIVAAGTGADAIYLGASAGGIDVDVALGFDLDAAGAVTLDSTAAGITVGGVLADGQVLQLGKSGAAEMTFSPHGTPASEKIGLVNTAGTADDAIKLDAVAGGFDINAGTSFDLDAAGAVSLDSVAGSMTMGAILADGQTLALGKSGAVNMVFTPHGTPANEKFLLTNTAGTAATAIKLDAAAGGIELDAAGLVSVNSTAASIEVGDVLADGQTLKLGKNGAVEVIISPHGTAANEKYAVINTGGDALDALAFVATAGGIEMDSSKAMTLNSGGGQILIGNDAVAQSVLVGGAGARPLISLGSTAAVKLVGVAKQAELSGSAGSVGLSGSFGIGFASDGGMTSHSATGMLFADYQDFGAFRAKSVFTAATTVIGAFNALADSVSGTEPTLFSLAVASDQNQGVLQTVTKIAGDETTLVNHAPNKMQVMVNGQVLRTGSAADFTNSVCDYVVNGDGTGRQLKFNFLLKADDLVQVWDFS